MQKSSLNADKYNVYVEILPSHKFSIDINEYYEYFTRSIWKIDRLLLQLGFSLTSVSRNNLIELFISHTRTSVINYDNIYILFNQIWKYEIVANKDIDVRIQTKM